MVVAQSMGEYGGLVGVFSDAVETLTRTLGTIVDSLRNAEPMTWAVILIIAGLLWLLFRRA